MTGMPVYPLYLGDVVNQARKAREFTAGMQFADFVADERTTYAVIRALEIIGEATRRTSADTLGKYPQIPWSRIVGLRNLLIHNYDDVQLQTVWDVVNLSLPHLLSFLENDSV